MIDHLFIEVSAVLQDDEKAENFCSVIGQAELFFAQCGECTVEQISKLIAINDRYVELSYWKSYKTKYINKLKEELLALLSKSVEYNSVADNKYIRKLNKSAIINKNVISVFESTLTRTLGIEVDELSTSIIVVKVYYFDVIKDLILNGFEYNGERYKFLTASAGQIRTKKTVFIKESLWNKYEKTLMCGLSLDSINEQGGVNVNKFIAYLALSNSATDQWDNFDIDKTIVVPDFETTIRGEVDHIDDVGYTVTRKEMDIAIEHTDGCGMILPSLSRKNFMVRLPWVKGLLASFDFVRFINEHNASPIVKDIYGVEHNIVEEDIQIIFTKSQFKMSKYYNNWDEYKDNFKKYNCQAGTCKMEEDYIKPAHINYQMLQTLTDLSDEEILKIATPMINKLHELTSNVGIMLETFGAIKGRGNLTPFQQALLLYPEMLEDNYCREVLKSLKDSLVKKAWHGKLPVKGKYTFLIPDLYAFCEQLFLHIDTPKGLLDNGEVSCRLYPKAEKLDCLRPPHLYKEHAVRKNIVNGEIKRWFDTDGVYTSSHDLISRILQFDNDGDTSLVVADENIIEYAERNMKGVVPLYYEMKKAEATELNTDIFYQGMAAAWSGGNIGMISNDITKIWNSGDSIGENEELAVKLLCMENNFTIDYAKCLYRPSRPESIDKFIRSYTHKKTPHFFKYAKNKTDSQVEPLNNSTVNKLRKFIPKKRISFKHMMKFNYVVLMNNKNINISQQVIDRFMEYTHSYHSSFRPVKNNEDYTSNAAYIAKLVRDSLVNEFDYSAVEIADMLVKHYYSETNSSYKNLLWLVYGDVILENIKNNTAHLDPYCIKCGKRFKRKSNRQKYCSKCSSSHTNKYRVTICVDCGKEFKVPMAVKNKKRCDECQLIHNKEVSRESSRRYRAAKL